MMKINKNNLQHALEIVKPGLANNEVIEQSTSFAFLDDRIVTYNDSISLSHPVADLDLQGAIRAEELYNLLSKIKDEEIQVAQSENELKLKSGKSKAGIRFQAEIKLPLNEIGNITDWKDLPEDFASDLDFIKDSASNDMSRRVLTCINIQKHSIVASDSFQIMRTYLPPENSFPFPDILIPAENISEITKIEPTLVAKTEGWIHFKNLDETVLSCRILVDDYPDVGEHFKVDGSKIVFPKSMPEILDRAMVFTKKDQLMDEEMQIQLKKNKLQVHGKNEYGWFKEKAPVKYSGKSASFWIAPYLLKNILDRSNTCTLGEEKILFKGEGWEYIAVLRS